MRQRIGEQIAEEIESEQFARTGGVLERSRQGVTLLLDDDSEETTQAVHDRLVDVQIGDEQVMGDVGRECDPELGAAER